MRSLFAAVLLSVWAGWLAASIAYGAGPLAIGVRAALTMFCFCFFVNQALVDFFEAANLARQEHP